MVAGLVVSRVAYGLRQALEVGFVGEVKYPIVEVPQGVLSEAHLQFAQLLGVAFEQLALLLGQGHTVAAEPLQCVLQQRLLLGGECFALGVQHPPV